MDVKDFAKLLHDNFCTFNHDDGCSWFYEDEYNWDAWSHKSWLEKAQQLFEDLVDPDELLYWKSIIDRL